MCALPVPHGRARVCLLCWKYQFALCGGQHHRGGRGPGMLMIVGLFWLCIRSLCGGQHHRGGRGPGMLMIVGLFWLCIRSLCGAVDLADRFQKSSDDVTLCMMM